MAVRPGDSAPFGLTAVGVFHDGYAVTQPVDSRTIVSVADVGGAPATLREQDAIIYDADDANAAQRYKFYFSVLNAGVRKVWTTFSADGLSWGTPQECTLGSGRQGEDPSILAHLSVAQRGHACRIGGKLVLYCEDSSTATVYGYESSDGVTFTELASNPVIPRGAGGQWDDTLTGSPCARWDGTNVIVGYEGRNASVVDKFGIASGTTPNALTKLAANPILAYGDVANVGPSIVVDSFDLDDEGDRVVLTGHDGVTTTGFGGWRIASATTTPLSWTTGSFFDLAPIVFNGTTSDVTLDNSISGQRVVIHDAAWQRMSSVGVVGWDQ